MRRSIPLFCVLALASTLLASPADGTPRRAKTPEPAQGSQRLIVRTEPGAEPSFRSLAGTFAPKDRRPLLTPDAYAVDLPEDTDVDEAIEAYEALPGVRSVERSVIYRTLATNPNDPRYGEQYSLENIMAPQAWDETKGGNRKIAVVDTGVRGSHEDLQGRVLAGRDFVNDDFGPNDDNGHGTAVAGIIAASTNNAKGIAGVTWNDKILPVKVLDASGGGFDSDIADGIRWAVDQGAKIVNLSLGAPEYSKILDDAVNYAVSKGALVVAGAGNDALSTPYFPAAFQRVLSVGATNEFDEIPIWFSSLADPAFGPNYGSTVDLTAPGDGILAPRHDDLDGYQSFTGTSMATPIVAGVAALAWASNPSMSVTQLMDHLRSSTDDLGLPGPDRYFGTGRINAFRAVGGAVSNPPSQDEPADEPADTLESATAIDGVQSATLYPSGDRDWWKTAAAVPAGGHLEVTVTPPNDADPILEVYGPDLSLVDRADEGWNGQVESLALNLDEGGTYYIGVENWLPHGSTNSYQISVSYGSGAGGASFVAPPGIERAFFTWYDAINSGRRNWVMTANAGGGDSAFSRTIASDLVDFLPAFEPGATDPIVYGGLIGGPVETRWPADEGLITSQRVLWKPDNFEEVSAVTSDDLTTHAWFSWYDGVNTKGADWVLASNPGPWKASVEIRFEGSIVAFDTLDPGQNLIWNDAGSIGGPVEVTSDQPILASRRTLWKGSNFSELTGVPDEDLSTSYLFPWYDADVTNGANWILVANPHDQAITVRIRIGNQVNQTFNVPPNDSINKTFPGVVGGPVRVTNDGGSEPFVTTQRNLFDSGRSFEEVPGLPTGSLPSDTVFSWYDAVNTGGADWVLVANPSTTSSVNVTIRIGGTNRLSNKSIPPGGIITPTFPGIVDGPVEVDANGPVATSRRTLWGKDFTELLGVPAP